MGVSGPSLLIESTDSMIGRTAIIANKGVYQKCHLTSISPLPLISVERLSYFFTEVVASVFLLCPTK